MKKNQKYTAEEMNPEAMWSVIDNLGGIYSVGLKGLYELSQTKYIQTGVGQMAYKEYIYNVGMYQYTGNNKFLNRAKNAEQMMITARYNIIRKKN